MRTSARTDGRAPRGLAQDLARAGWRARRSYHASDFPLARLLEEKRSTVALLLPAREVAATIGPVAQTAARLRDAGLLDEVLVIDAASEDGTAAIARRAGVAVAQERELLGVYGPAQGKGDAMWGGLRATGSDIVAYADTTPRTSTRASCADWSDRCCAIPTSSSSRAPSVVPSGAAP